MSMNVILSLSICLVIHAYANPQIGFLSIHHCLDKKDRFTPILNGNELAKNPLKGGEKLEGLYFASGTYKLTFKSPSLVIKPIDVIIKQGLPLTIIVTQLFDSRAQVFTPHVTVVRNPLLGAAVSSLFVKSFCHEKLVLEGRLSGTKISGLGHAYFLNWSEQSLELKVNSQKFPVVIREDTTRPSSLIIWKEEAGYNFNLISHPHYEQPRSLRNDLGFGVKRAQIKNLKTLKRNSGN